MTKACPCSPPAAGNRWLTVGLLACALVLAGAPVLAAAAAGEDVLLEEQFDTLARWQPQSFAKIPRHSRYRAVVFQGRSCLLMESDNSASALVLGQSFDVYQYPGLAWRWRVSNVFVKGDSSRKQGDDYPARLYVMFAYDPARASLGKRLQYQMARTLYGQYPPDSSISYIWDNRPTGAAVITNAYSAEAKMVPIDAGPERVNTWQEHRVDIVRDYHAAFGHDPPATATLAVMSDADNTGESARAWIDYIRIFRRQ